jgi:putative toxin-antitoxin system antitoxin component (TIGR02293 family)
VAICAYNTGIWRKEFSMRAATIDRPVARPEDTSEESLYARVSALLGLRSALHSEVDLIDRLEKGLTMAAVQTLRTRVGLTDEETFQLIAPRRTLSRREASGQVLSREEADRTVRIARVSARAQQVFAGKPEYAAEWLRTAKSALGDRTPMQALATESGALAVEELLVGIEHGMFG